MPSFPASLKLERPVILFIVVAVIAIAGAFLLPSLFRPSMAFTLTSSAFADNQRIPAKYTCAGEGISMPLSIANVPQEAKSLAITLFDPDAPGKGFNHWTLYNIAPGTTAIAEGKIPSSSKEGRNDTGKTGYFGPCPPTGTHRYVLTLYALDTLLKPKPDMTLDILKAAMQYHVIGRTALTGIYSQ